MVENAKIDHVLMTLMLWYTRQNLRECDHICEKLNADALRKLDTYHNTSVFDEESWNELEVRRRDLADARQKYHTCHDDLCEWHDLLNNLKKLIADH
jgi:DNA repair ATPase RecN